MQEKTYGCQAPNFVAEVPDGIYHVTRRGLERRAIVRDDADRRRSLGLLEGMATRRSWRRRRVASKVRGLDARLAQLEAQLRQDADPKT